MIKPRVNKLYIAIFSIIALSLSPVSSAYASTPTLGHEYQNGVGNIAAWLDYSSGVGYWSSYITDAADNWMYPGWSNPIYVTS